MQIGEIIATLENIAPLSFQESYDNSGLLIGTDDQLITKALITLDITEPVIDEAIRKGCNLIISHHPLIFTGIKKLVSGSSTERIVVKAIKNDIAIYAAHTNLDNASNGVNALLCRKLGIQNPRILKPASGLLKKLVTFCPASHAQKVRETLFEAGTGIIGNYDSCSFSVSGEGTFRALEGSSPFIGTKNELHSGNEVRIETIFPSFLQSAVIKALILAHPYEEVAYDIIPLDNHHPWVGAGMIGELLSPLDELSFLKGVKDILGAKCIRYSSLSGKEIQKIAVCGGAGSFLINDAIAAGADVFLTGDVRYHDFFIPEGRILVADVGHFESEQFTKELIFAVLLEKFPTFAVQISETGTNPVSYL
jgi:dinuclear metal center YbgI/SA1388 family protein